MPTHFSGDSPEADNDEEEIPAATYEEVLRWLDQLRRSDRSLYNLMAIEVWSVAQTIDDFMPGFWSRFMTNRQLALKEFVEQRKQQHGDSTRSSHQPNDSSHQESGKMESEAGGAERTGD